MKNYFLCLYFISSIVIVNGQAYSDYVGSGHDNNVVVTSSGAELNMDPQNTIDASGMDAKKMEASRFLNQATFGADSATICSLEDLQFEQWINNQLTLPPSLLLPKLDTIWDTVYQMQIDSGIDPNMIFGPYSVHFNYTWWQTIVEAEDQLRQRMAFALSEIMVVSIFSQLGDYGHALASYYDVLVDNALGNYKQLLLDVTYHPSMGHYLSHFENPKTDTMLNTHPDENYAREIMQLFSIGLYELNNDGSRKKDNTGALIPTYDDSDIDGLSKVFTGLGAGDIEDWVDWTTDPYFYIGFWATDKTVPMIMYEDYHEPGEKNIVGGYTIPGGQTGDDDIEDAIDHLFNHPNVGPFIAEQLIKRLITSNPSRAFVDRIASIFNDNGNGVRGDLGAVAKAILMDEESRSCGSTESLRSGRLREPVLRYSQVVRALPKNSPLGRFWNNGFNYLDATSQHPLAAPSVFNFFPPDHIAVGPLSDAGLEAPEFRIHNTKTSIGYINEVNAWTIWDYLMYSWEGDFGDPDISLNTTSFEHLAEDPENLINHLDILFSHGQLSDEIRTIIRDAINPFIWGDYNYDRTRLALYLLLISPDYTIMK